MDQVGTFILYYNRINIYVLFRYICLLITDYQVKIIKLFTVITQCLNY